MKILGIDPGSRSTGFALIEVIGRKIAYLDSGVLKFDSETEFLSRLGKIYQASKDLLSQYKPDEVSLESLIFVKSATSHAKLAQARGAMIAAFSDTHIGKIFEYSPNLVKVSVVGHGHANKESVMKGLDLIFGKRKYKTHDESDALAIAVCHALNSRGRR